MGKVIRVKKGKEILEIEDTDLQSAVNDGYLPTERVIVSNTKTNETYEIDPQDLPNAFKDGFSYGSIKKKEPTSDELAKKLVSGVSGAMRFFGIGGTGGASKVQSKEIGSQPQPLIEPEISAKIPAFKTAVQREIDKNKSIDKDKAYSYLYDLKSPEEKALSKETESQQKERLFITGAKKLSNYINTEDPVSNIKNSISSAKDAISATDDILALNVAKEAFSSDTKLAVNHLLKRGLISSFEQAYSLSDSDIDKLIDHNNQTDVLAASKLKDSNRVFSSINNASNLEEAAVLYESLNNPVVKKQIEENQQLVGGQPISAAFGNTLQTKMANPKELFSNETLGKMVYNLINNPETHSALKNSPLYDEYLRRANNLVWEYPDFGKIFYGNLISQQMEDNGTSNAILNVVTKEETDKAVNELMASGKMNEDGKRFYEEYMRGSGIKNLWKKMVYGNEMYDTPGLVESAAGGFGDFVRSTAKGAYEFSGVRKQLFGDSYLRYADLKEGDSKVDITPNGITHNITQHGGNMLGLSLGIGGAGKLLESAKLINSPNLAASTAMFFTAYGNYAPQARALFPDSEFKQQAYSGILSAFEGITENIFKDRKVVDGLTKKLSPTVSKTIKDFTSGNITALAAKNNITKAINNVIDFSKYSAKGVGENTIEELVMQGMTNLTEGVFSGKPINEWVNSEELYETGRVAMLGSLFLGGLSGRSDMMRNRGVTARSIYDMAQNQQYWKTQIEQSGNVSGEDVSDQLNNLEFAAKVLEDVDKKDLTEKQKIKYVFNSLTNEINRRNAESVTDPTIKKSEEEKIKETEKTQLDILENKDDGTFEDDTKDQDLTEDQKVIESALKNNEIKDSLFIGMAEKALNDPELAKQIIDESKEQVKGEVGGEAHQLGSAESGQRNTWGNTIVDYAMSGAKSEPATQGKELGQESGQSVQIDNPALRDVESTAKALETESKNKPTIWEQVKQFVKGAVKKVGDKLGVVSNEQHLSNFEKAKQEWDKLSPRDKKLKRADYELDDLHHSEGGYYKVGNSLIDLDLNTNHLKLLLENNKFLNVLNKLGVTKIHGENRPAEEMFAHYSDNKIHLNNNSAFENIRQVTNAMSHELGHHEWTKLTKEERDYVRSLPLETGMAKHYEAQEKSGKGKETSASLQEENFADYVMQYFQGKLYGDEALLNKIPTKLRELFDNKYSDLLKDNEHTEASEAYHKAKADGSNPELVKAVESLLSKEQAPDVSNEGLGGEEISPEVKAIEQERDNAIVEAYKPELGLEFINDADFVKTDTPREFRNKQKDIRKKFSALKALVNCK